MMYSQVNHPLQKHSRIQERMKVLHPSFNFKNDPSNMYHCTYNEVESFFHKKRNVS